MFEVNATELPRFMACNGSRLLGGSMPPSNDDPTARNEGTAAHWLVTHCYHQNAEPGDFIGMKAPNGVTITNTIVKGVMDFFNYVISCQGAFQNMEQVCSFEWSGYYRVNARCDFYSFDGQTLTIADFKFGYRIVEPKDNWTLIAYAIGLCQDYEWNPQNIVFQVHQPRVPHPEGTVRQHRLSREELQNRLEHLHERMTRPNDQLNTGPHCDKCRSLTVCPANRTAVFNAVDISTTAHAENLTDDHISQELAILQDADKRLKARRKQLEDLAVYRLREGAIIDGYGLQRSYGNRAWRDGLTPDFLSALTGVDCQRIEAISPAQAVKKGAMESVVNNLSDRSETGLKLARVSAHKQAEKLFGTKGS